MGIRTTVTLDEDVLERLKQESRSRGVPVRQLLNDSLRKALLAAPSEIRKREFYVTPRSTGLRTDLGFDDIQGLFDYLDGPEHR